MPPRRDDIATQLNRLTMQLQTEAAKPAPPRRRRGRPDAGIRRGFIRTEVYLPPVVHDTLSRLADRSEIGVTAASIFMPYAA